MGLHTAWKVSVFGVFLVHIFPHSDCIGRDTPYAGMRENADLKNSEYGRLGSEYRSILNALNHTWILNCISQEVLIWTSTLNLNGKYCFFNATNFCLKSSEYYLEYFNWRKINSFVAIFRIFKCYSFPEHLLVALNFCKCFQIWYHDISEQLHYKWIHPRIASFTLSRKLSAKLWIAVSGK